MSEDRIKYWSRILSRLIVGGAILTLIAGSFVGGYVTGFYHGLDNAFVDSDKKDLKKLLWKLPNGPQPYKPQGTDNGD